MKKQRSTSTADIWRTCLHEAAHVVVARALNYWNTSVSARVDFIEGGGAAIMPRGLSHSGEAAATAAGQYGGKLIRFFPAPRRRPIRLPPKDTTEAKRARALREVQAEAARLLRKQALTTGSDEKQVARFCIYFNLTDPKDWTWRFRRIHATARLEVWRHRHEIRKAAVTLFHEGEIVIPGDPEHETFFSRLHGAAGGEQNTEGGKNR